VVFLFDTNHICVWQRGEGAQYERLCTRLEKHNGDQIYVCIVSFHELVIGWNAFSAKNAAVIHWCALISSLKES
jgi:PIN domain nuclease of toxin-antitoxin system